MLPFGVTIPATVPQRSEIPEGLMNYTVEAALAYERKSIPKLYVLKDWKRKYQSAQLCLHPNRNKTHHFPNFSYFSSEIQRVRFS